MSTLAVAAVVSCTYRQGLPVPQEQLEECVYLGNKTKFAVWAPDAQAAQLKLYISATDDTAF